MFIVKKISIVSIFIMASFSAHSQIKKGNIQLGGSIGYNKNSQVQLIPFCTYNFTSGGWNIQPTAGWFVTESSSLGIGIGYSQINTSNKSSNSNQYQQNTTNQELFTAKPYYRVHKSISPNFALFAELNGLYGFGNSKNILEGSSFDPFTGAISSSRFEVSEKLKTWGVSLSPGLIFFPNEKWGIDLSVGLLGYSEVIGDISKTSSNLNLLANLSNLSFGIKYYVVK